MRLIFAPGVRAQVQKIHSYIAADNLHAADEVVARIYGVIEMLRENPSLGRSVSGSRLRRFPVKPHPYLVYYDVAGDMLRIVRVRHAAQFRRAFQEPQQVFAR